MGANMQAIADQVRVDAEILRLYKGGLSYGGIKAHMGVGGSRIARVLKAEGCPNNVRPPKREKERTHGRGMVGQQRPTIGGDNDRIKALIYAGWEASAVEDELGITGVVEWHHRDNAWLTANGYCRRCEIKSETALCPDCVREGLTPPKRRGRMRI